MPWYISSLPNWQIFCTNSNEANNILSNGYTVERFHASADNSSFHPLEVIFNAMFFLSAFSLLSTLGTLKRGCNHRVLWVLYGWFVFEVSWVCTLYVCCTRL